MEPVRHKRKRELPSSSTLRFESSGGHLQWQIHRQGMSG